jgi:LPXTG-motif cell wall-anchored protein
VLPPTGGDVWNRLAIAAGLVLAGLALVAIDRRRRIIS